MTTALTIAVYDALPIAKLVARTLEAAGIAGSAIHLIAAPDLVPADADLTVRDQLHRLGVPEHEAQLYADMVQGGDVLIVVTTTEGGEDYRRAVAVLNDAKPSEPIVTVYTHARIL